MYRESQPELQPDRSLLVVALAGHVAGIDRDTGEMRWTHKLSTYGAGEAVFLAVGYGVVVVATEIEKLVCIDYLTGAIRWEAPTSNGGRATILLEADRIVCAKGGYVDCFDPYGRKVWTQPLKGFGLGRCSLGFPGNVAQADDIGDR